LIVNVKSAKYSMMKDDQNLRLSVHLPNKIEILMKNKTNIQKAIREYLSRE